MIGNKKTRKVIGEQNGLKIYSKLQAKKRINKITLKQKLMNEEWSKNVKQKCKDLNFICQWCGLKGLPTSAGLSRNCLTGHHIIKRRFGINTYENVYVCHWTCHDFIETHAIKVEVYPNKEAWEKRNETKVDST